MKKLLLVLTTLLSLSAFAQKALTVTLDSPATNQNIYKDRDFTIQASLKNTGTDTIYATDSIYTYLAIEGTPITPMLILHHDDILVDSTVILTFPLTGGVSGPDDMLANLCLHVTFSLIDSVIWMNACHTVNYINHGVGVKELAAAKSLQVFPNPAVDVLNITFDYAETTHLNIMDITGRTVKTMPIEAGSAKVNVGDMAKGVYLYSITTNDGQVIKTGKFSVSR